MGLLQRDRLRDPYPWTWEVPLAVAGSAGAAIVGGVHVGRAAANFVAGIGWHWPAGAQLLISVPGVLAGNARAGLRVASGAVVASPASVWLWVGVVELTIAATGAVLASLVLRSRGGLSAVHGMATAQEARALLGRRRLWRTRHVVRPDLYSKSAASSRDGP